MKLGRPRRARWLGRWLTGIAFLILVLNGLAYMQARSMTQFTASGRRTSIPERISFPEKLEALLFGVRIPRPSNGRTPAEVGLRYQTTRIPASAGSLEAWVVPRNDSRGWVVLFHGYADSKASLLEIAERFHRDRFGVVLVDFRGSGGSSGSSTTLGYAEASDVADVARFVAETLGEPAPILYGFSMGAAAILRAVALLRVPARAIVVQGVFDRLLTTVQHRFEMLRVPAFPSAEVLLFWGGRVCHFDAFTHNPVEYATRVEVPTLVLHGAKDERVTLNEAAAIHANLRGQRALHVFPTGMHDPIAGVTETEWRSAVTSFLAGAAVPQSY